MNDAFLPVAQFIDATIESFTRHQAELLEATLETIYMVGASTALSFVFGFGLATLMILTGPRGVSPAPKTYAALDLIVDLGRSFPFLILIIAIMPITRLIMGTAIGTTATILPLTIAAIPFAARLIETNFLEVDRGVVEAARSFGATSFQIIFRVLVPEALPAIVLNVAVLAITLLGYSAMAGAVGGGGLGYMAFRLGYNQFQTDVMIWCVLVLVVIVSLIQKSGNLLYRWLR